MLACTGSSPTTVLCEGTPQTMGGASGMDLTHEGGVAGAQHWSRLRLERSRAKNLIILTAIARVCLTLYVVWSVSSRAGCTRLHNNDTHTNFSGYTACTCLHAASRPDPPSRQGPHLELRVGHPITPRQRPSQGPLASMVHDHRPKRVAHRVDRGPTPVQQPVHCQNNRQVGRKLLQVHSLWVVPLKNCMVMCQNVPA